MRLFYFIALFPLLINAQSSDFKVDCGNDIFFCEGLISDTTMHIGSQVILTNGEGPYKYSWSCTPIKVSSNLTFTTSDFLNDTSLLNPYIKDYGVTNKPWCFYLTVEDKNNNKATDSVYIKISRFIYNTLEYDFYMHIGDSFQFYDQVVVGGGIPPVKYYWTPTIGLDDSTKIDAWCSSQISIDYYQYIIDSAGCISLSNRMYNVYILPTSIQNKYINNSQLNLYLNGSDLCFNNPENRLAIISFYSIKGGKIFTVNTKNAFINISDLLKKNKVYICTVTIDKLVGTLKFYTSY